MHCFPYFYFNYCKGIKYISISNKSFCSGCFFVVYFVCVCLNCGALLENKCADVDSCSDVCSHTAATYIQISVS